MTDPDRTFRRVAVLAAAYFLVQAIVLAILRTGTSFDGAEQLLYTQYWDLGYGRSQPPLYTWLLIAVQSLFGVTILAENLLKFSLLAAGIVLAYCVGRRASLSAPTAAGAAGAIFLLPEIGWEAQRNYSHSVLLFALGFVLLLVYLHARDRGGRIAYLGFGLVAAAIFLTKYNGMGLVACLLAADAVVHRRGALLMRREMLLALLVFVPVVLPHVAWMVLNREAVFALSHKFEIGAAESDWSLRIAALGRFGLVLLAVYAPLAAVTVAGFLVPPRLAAGRPGPLPPPIAVIALTIGFGLASALAAMLATGATNIEPRWLIPYAAPTPIVVAAVLSQMTGKDRPARVFAMAGVAAALVAALALWANSTVFARRTQHDYAALLDEIRRAGPVATVVTDEYALYANLRLYEARLRVVDPAVPTAKRIFADPAVVIWTGSERPGEALQALAGRLGVAIDVESARTYTMGSIWNRRTVAVRIAATRPAP